MGGNIHQFFTTEPSRRLEQKTREWDLNEWKWDGEAFIAVPVSPGPLECRNKQPLHDMLISNSSSTGFDECHFRIIGKGFGEAEKRRRILVVGDDEQCDEVGSLSLNLGCHAYPVMEESLDIGGVQNGKRDTTQDSNLNHPKCQVDGCGVELSQSKDYHRRHKVCEVHSKASSAVIGNVVQRFCQQCSRFHLLQEFDEGKRSCRRRLAGHNRRRRKNHSDVSPSGNSALDDQSTGHLLIGLLRILANLTCDKSQQPKDNELVWNLLRNVASLASSSDINNSPQLFHTSPELHTVRTSAGTSSEAATILLSHADPKTEKSKSLCLPTDAVCASSMEANNCALIPAFATEKQCQQNVTTVSFCETAQENCSKRTLQEENGLSAKLGDLCSWQKMLPCTIEGTRIKEFDLNAAYIEQHDGKLGCKKPENQTTLVFDSSICPPWMAKSCHRTAQISGIKNSTSARSPASFNGDAQSRTDRIVFKLFGKDPNDIPLILRAQIFDWLSHTPTDMESYIRPGCIILTVYLCLGVSAWDELCHDFESSLIRLLNLSNDTFWGRGWIYARLRNHITVIYNGQIMLHKSLIMESTSFSKILTVTPIAAPPSKVTFVVKGSNLLRCTTRLLCAFEGRYLVQETEQSTVECVDYESQHEQLQSVSFSCFLSDAIGRGFIEVEDNGLSSGFFPFIVAEEDVCAEIRMLESSLDIASCDEVLDENIGIVRSQSVNFIHEMGWLLRKSWLKSKLESNDHCFKLFSIVRFKWILRFSVDHDWPATVKKLLDILFDGIVDLGGILPVTFALSENLLHYAVQRNSKLTVKLLLSYKPCKSLNGGNENIFRPDMLGPSDITPLHLAATNTHESMLDLLTDDPGQFGVKAWRSTRDSFGFTPEDYALARGNESYILLMQKKTNRSKKIFDVAVSIPANLSLGSDDGTYKKSENLKSAKLVGFGISNCKPKPSQPLFCKLCEQQLLRGNSMRRSLLYRPMLLSLVGIAAVCVCVALIFKGPPDVLFVYSPFRWELLESGFR